MASAGDISRAMAENQKLREDLALAYRALAYYELQESINNHVSVRAPSRGGNGDVMLIIAHGMHWTQVTANNLIGVDFTTGDTVEGDGKIDYFAKNIHLAIHKAKASKGITCVMHTHQPYATAITCCHGRLVNCHQNNMQYHDRIAYDDSYDLPDEKEGERIAKAMGDKDILFMGNHGITVCAPRICDAFDDVYMIERAAKIQVLAMSTGMKLVEASDEIADKNAKYEGNSLYAHAHFEAMRPIISKMEPDYKS